MPRPREHDPDAVKDALALTFLRFGYAGTSFSELEAATQLNRAQLSRSYGSKKRLFLNALSRTMDWRYEEHLRPLATHGGLDEIRNLLLAIAGSGQSEEGKLGCLVCNTCREAIAMTDPDVRKLIQLHFRRVEDAFAGALGNAVAAGTLNMSEDDIRRSSRLLYGIKITLLVLTRAGETPSVLRDIALQAVHSISEND
ncbi:MAG: TetR/AcrR family transcriptional regulator [Pseudomonadota bacterium]